MHQEELSLLYNNTFQTETNLPAQCLLARTFSILAYALLVKYSFKFKAFICNGGVLQGGLGSSIQVNHLNAPLPIRLLTLMPQ